MAEEFDPYRKWLGIPPDEQPANHYRLLGIALFEDDPDVIQNAADRQMKHVRTFQTGRHGPLSQRLMNELSAAKVCLLTAEDKSKYDDGLRAEIEAREAANRPAPVPVRPAAQPRPPLPPPPAPEPAAPEPILVGQPAVETINVNRGKRIGLLPGESAPAPVGPVKGVPAGRPIPVESTGPSAPAPGEDFPASVRSSGSPRLRGDRGSAWPMILGLGGLVGIGLVILAVLMAGGFGGTKPTGQGDTPPKRIDPVPPKPTPPRPRPSELPKPGTNPPMHAGGTIETPLPMPSAPNLETELALARTALGKRDRDAAQRHLVEATHAAGMNSESKAKVEQLQALASYLGEFWNGVRRGIFQAPLDGGEFTFTYRDREYRLIGREGEEIHYKVEGREHRTKIADLPARDAVAFARSKHGLPANSPWSDIFVASFYHFDKHDPGEGRKQIAERLWKQAKDAGQPNVYLAHELGLEKELPADADPHPKLPEDFGTTPPVGPVSSNPPEPMTPRPMPMPSPMTPRPMTPSGPVAGPSGKLARPVGSEETAAMEKVRRAYDAALAKAKTDDEALIGLVKMLYGEAKKEQDPAQRYAKMSLASDVSFQGARIEAGLLIVEEMADVFELDATREKLARLGKLKYATLPQDRMLFAAQQASSLFDEAVARHDYVLAQEAGTVFLAASKAASDGPNERRGREMQEAVRELVTEQKSAESRVKMLETMPDDPTANFLVGKFKCWGEQDWAAGLPMLAKGNDKDLADLAAAELTSPTAAADKLKVAEGWFLQGKRRKSLAGDHILDHAREWFEQALADGDATVKAAAERRLKEIRETPPALVPAAPLPMAM